MLKAESTMKESLRAVSNKFGCFMDTVVGGVNRLDSFLGFHMDLFAHCDGELSGLMQDKAATLFSPTYRSAVKGSRTEQDPPLGFFGGEKAVRSKLSEASKEDDLLVFHRYPDTDTDTDTLLKIHTDIDTDIRISFYTDTDIRFSIILIPIPIFSKR